MVEARETGEADVLEVFTLTLNRKDRAVGMSKHTAVAGSRVTAGQASAGSAVRVVRGGEVTHEGGGVLSGRLGSSRVLSGPLGSSRVLSGPLGYLGSSLVLSAPGDPRGGRHLAQALQAGGAGRPCTLNAVRLPSSRRGVARVAWPLPCPTTLCVWRR